MTNLISAASFGRASTTAEYKNPCVITFGLGPPAQFLEKIRKLQPKVSSGKETDQRTFSGERFLPGYADGSIELEHLHRYAFALPFAIDRTVIDIACGEGYGSDLLAQVAKTVIGVDVDEASIALARQRYDRPNLSFAAGSATAIPLEDNSVDAVVTFETIEHLDDQFAFWAEIKRVLRPSGVLIISSPNRQVYGEQRSEHNPFHKRELSRAELVGEISWRFSHHCLFSQTVVFGSLLMPESLQPGPPYVMALDPTTRTLSWRLGDEWTHPYSVVVASDEPIPVTGQSLYLGGYPPGAMSSLVGGIVERDQLVRDLRQRVLELESSQIEQNKLGPPREIALLETALQAAQREQDALVVTTRKMEEARMEEAQILTSSHAQAILEATRLRETLAEQDGVIVALKALLEERSGGLMSSTTGTNPGRLRLQETKS